MSSLSGKSDTASEKGEDGGGWQRVTSRKHKPTVQPYKPFDPNFSFASAVRTPSPQHIHCPNPKHPEPPMNQTTNTTTSPPASPPPSQATFYLSPHSPTQLRFPPSSHFNEWRGRCFRCCRTGHSIATCRNPLKCGKCWGEGHTSFRCKGKSLNPAAMPYWANKAKFAPVTTTKLIDDRLLKPNPLAASTLPAARPKRLEAFSPQDQATMAEISKLNGGVVFNTHGLELDFTIKDVA